MDRLLTSTEQREQEKNRLKVETLGDDGGIFGDYNFETLATKV